MCRPATLLFVLASLASGCNCGDDIAAGADSGPTDAALIDAVVPNDAASVADATPGQNCKAPLDLPLGVPIVGDTSVGGSAGGFGSCSPDTGVAPDRVYYIDVGPDPVDLITQVDNDGVSDPPFDVVVYTRLGCTVLTSEVSCSDVNFSEHLETLDVTDDVFVFVDGTDQFGGTNSGQFTMTASTRAIVAVDAACDPAGISSRCAANLRCSASVCVGDSEAVACNLAEDLTPGLPGPIERTATTFPFSNSFFRGSCAFDDEGDFDEDIFQIDVPDGATLVATTDFPETEFDTYLYLYSGTCSGGTEVACSDDIDPSAGNFKTTLTASGLAAGTYFLFIDGSSPNPGTGQYRLSVTVQP